MRLIIFLILLSILGIYGFYALRSTFSTRKGRARRMFKIVYWLPMGLMLFLFLDSYVLKIIPPYLFIYLRAIVFIGFISVIFLIVPFLVEDLTRIGRYFMRTIKPGPRKYMPSRSRFIRNAALGIAAIPFTSMTYGMLGNQYRFRKISQDIPVKGLHRDLHNLKIVQISDIHAGTFVFKEPLYNIIEIINSAAPDIVVFTGDLVNNKADEIERFIDVFGEIKARYGVYSILGNHDYGDYVQWANPEEKEKNMLDMYKYQAEMGWDLLRNENRIISVGEASIGLLGVENFSTMNNFPRKGDLEKAMKGAEDTDLKILLSHDPTHWDYEVNSKFKDINLTLSGHTHGFQFGMEIPGIIKWSPSQYAYKQWAGLYKKENQYIYVNRGVGCLAYPGRVGILPEITEIRLKSV